MRVVTFGEVMLRLAPEGFVRLRQALPGRLEATYGGGELNVAVSIALQGGRAAFLTAVAIIASNPPMQTGVMVASAPPANMTCARPRRIHSAASPSA